MQSAKTTKPGTLAPGAITNLHSPLRLTRFKTTPETSTDAPMAKASDLRAVCKSVALLKTVCIAVSPNLSIFGLLIC
jgi:hypothetical protein